jgi:deoxyribodipyrimidine photo-lyase
LKEYKQIRNGFIGADYSSKLSPWLALGCLSPRWIAAEVARYEKERIKNDSTYWLIFELIWREYWRYAFLKHGNAYFFLEGISPETQIWIQNKTSFERWRMGQTGFPIVDANMRELHKTGWMSNRGRQIVASFFAKNLELDWRWGAAWFESQLVDYDVYSNWGNWAYVAGVGNDGRDRYFNLVTQAENYDSNGEFMKLWCPELNEINGATLRVLHQLSDSERMMYGLHGDVYPKPMIDLEKSYQKLNQKRR